MKSWSSSMQRLTLIDWQPSAVLITTAPFTSPFASSSALPGCARKRAISVTIVHCSFEISGWFANRPVALERGRDRRQRRCVGQQQPDFAVLVERRSREVFRADEG